MTALNYPPRTFQNCANCHYFVATADWSECRRHPPEIGLTFCWPQVTDRDWCGEWTPLNDVPD